MNALQVFEPGSRAVYTIEVAAQMAQVPRRSIVLYYKHGPVAPVTDPAGAGWYFDDEAVRIVRLPFAPLTIAVRRDGVMLIVLTDSLVSVGRDHQVSTLISEAPWEGLYPASSILLPDEDRLYIGMRQFVGEVDLATSELRMLLPSTKFLNKLPDDQERLVRGQYSTGRGSWQSRHPPAGICEELEKKRVMRNDR